MDRTTVDRFVNTSTHLSPRLVSPDSAWNEHIPFAGWIVEAAEPRRLVELGTHTGVSYFAFCESVRRIGLPTECYAVDHWLGDEHAGFYGDEIFDAVKRLNDEHYNSFSRLLRRSFDEALDEFDDQSIDLLHLDGLHTYEAVKHDVDSWLPKLSERGVLLLHDTNEHKKDFGVFRVLSELQEHWPTFEFTHGHGLGVVAVGAEFPDRVLELVNLPDDSETSRDIRDLYAALGKRFSQQAEIQRLSADVAKRREDIDKLQKRETDLQAQFRKRESEIRTQLDRTKADADRATVRLHSALGDLAASRVHLAQAREAESEAKAKQAELQDAVRRSRKVLDDERSALRRAKSALKNERKKRQRAMSRFRQLKNRRSVRIALWLASLAKPLYQLRARLRSRGRLEESAANSEPVAEQRSDSASPVRVALSDRPPSVAPKQSGSSALESRTQDRQHDLIPNHVLNGRPHPIDIIVPIFNAAASVKRCLDALERNSSQPAQLVLVDDASTDPEVGELLNRYEDKSNVRVVRNRENLGFTKSVNAGLRLTEHDVVILNSDVEVGPGWLDHLRFTARFHPDAATITPVSDNAGAFSVPETGVANPLPDNLDLDQTARLVRSHVGRLHAHAPTGNGYCMYIRRNALDQLGPFDEEAFPRGYGEENDWCMKAERAGWKNIVDGSVFVRHERSASFGNEKHTLMKRGREVIDARYPEYTKRVSEFVSSPELQAIRESVTDAFEKAPMTRRDPRPRVLFVLHGGGGGTRETNADLMLSLIGRYEAFILQSDGASMTLGRVLGDEIRKVSSWQLSEPITPQHKTHADYRQIVGTILTDHGIDLVHIRHLIGHSLDLPGVAQALGIPVVLSFHDYYYVCPSVHLLDNKDQFCGGSCTPGQGICRVPTEWLSTLPHLKHGWVNEWQTRIRSIFKDVDAFVTASNAAQSVYLHAFPELAERDFEVIPHGREFPDDEAIVDPEISPDKVKIAILGNLTVHKGSHLIREMCAQDTEGLLEFHFLGSVPESLFHLGIHHGSYSRADLAKRLAAIRPSMVGVLSITAETYSHVVSEAWAHGIPVLATDLGAPAERIQAHGGGWTIPHDDPTAAVNAIRGIAADTDEWERVRADANLGSIRMVSEMASDYAFLYERIWNQRRAFRTEQLLPVRTSLAVVGTNGEHPGSVYVRTLTRWTHPEIRNRAVSSVIDVKHFLDETDPDHPDLMYVQRTAVPPSLVDDFINRCRDLGTSLILDLDDDILNLESGASSFRDYEGQAAPLRRLAAAADLVTVSTKPLAASLRGVARHVEIVPNRLDERLWARPLSPPPPENGPLQLLYYGTRTHADDLALLKPVIELLRDELPVELNVIGVENPNPNSTWYHRIDVPLGKARYPDFAAWLHEVKDEFHAAVVPLVDNHFNRSKSDLKFLETAALGLPGIFSKVVPYSESIIDGSTGLLAANTVEDWRSALERLLADSDLRNQIRQGAYEYVMQQGLLRDQISWYADLVIRTIGDSTKQS